jgi:predicted ATP-dependent endonuclease of OLD family
MLDSLLIKNYRILKEFKINSLARINLITGKNNTGKSTILEALAIYACKGDMQYILQLSGNRGEYFGQSEINVKSLSPLFTDRTIAFGEQHIILIGNIDCTRYINLKFAKYEELQNGSIVGRKILPDDDENKMYKTGFMVSVSTSSNKLFTDEMFNITGYNNMFTPDKLQFIRTWNIDADTAGNLFDNVILMGKEQYVIEALRIIEPKTERIAFIMNESRRRNAVIKLSDMTETLPLKSMGDGMNRILTVILALVNAENGFLLIDEFENGLHYKIQKQLWKIIFELSKLLNIQVFVTTHSNDCISGFAGVLNSSDNTVDGKLIRLENINGHIKHVEYLSEELKIANEQQIETR